MTAEQRRRVSLVLAAVVAAAGALLQIHDTPLLATSIAAAGLLWSGRELAFVVHGAKFAGQPVARIEEDRHADQDVAHAGGKVREPRELEPGSQTRSPAASRPFSHKSSHMPHSTDYSARSNFQSPPQTVHGHEGTCVNPVKSATLAKTHLQW